MGHKVMRLSCGYHGFAVLVSLYCCLAVSQVSRYPGSGEGDPASLAASRATREARAKGPSPSSIEPPQHPGPRGLIAAVVAT